MRTVNKHFIITAKLMNKIGGPIWCSGLAWKVREVLGSSPAVGQVIFSLTSIHNNNYNLLLVFKNKKIIFICYFIDSNKLHSRISACRKLKT